MKTLARQDGFFSGFKFKRLPIMALTLAIGVLAPIDGVCHAAATSLIRTTLTVTDIGGGPMGGVSPDHFSIGDQFDLVLAIDETALASMVWTNFGGQGGAFGGSMVSISMVRHSTNTGSYDPTGLALKDDPNTRVEITVPNSSHSSVGFRMLLTGGESIPFTYGLPGEMELQSGNGSAYNADLYFIIPFITVEGVGQPLSDLFFTTGATDGSMSLLFSEGLIFASSSVVFSASNYTYEAVPEPGTVGLVAVGLGFAAFTMRKRRRG